MNLLVSYDWLKEYVKLRASPKEFAAKLSLCGPSIERLYPQGAALDKVVVGKILKVKAHPDPKTTKLRVVETDLGTMTKDIVCGGSNLVEGQLVVVALPGSWVKWHGEGEPIEIKEAELRGAPSYGMICGADEIGLLDRFPKKEEKEIVDLTALNFKPGTPLAEALKMNDVIFDVEVTSNRPDAYSMLGMACEASAILDAPMLWRPPKAPQLKKSAKTLPLSVEVKSKKLCPRYKALVMTNVKVGPSPAWLKERLASAGQRSINNLVDITNFVRLELGQPLHVFDYDMLKGKKIVVREAVAGEKMKALDGNTYELKAGQLVIADAERPVAVAGVMGGEETGTTEKTTTIVIEAAAFDPVSIRRTARALSLHSDSSKLYEKGLSTELVEIAMERAAELAAELAGAEVASKRIDVRAAPYKKLVFPFRPARAAELIGVTIPAARMKKILTDLGFKVAGAAAKWSVTVPFWRDHDIEGERDLVEEVARVYGYGNLPSVIPDGTLPLGEPSPALAWEDKAKRFLKDWGYTELMTYSFISKDLAEKVGADPKKLLRVSNPLNEEFEYMRDRLGASMLKIVAENQEEAVEGRAFELANVYLPRENDLPIESPRLMLLVWGREQDGRYVSAAKGALEALFEEFGVRGLKIERQTVERLWHPGRTGLIQVGGETLGMLGEFHPELLAKFGIERRVAAVSLDFAKLLEFSSNAKFYAPIPEFPRVKRDLAFVVDRHLEHAAAVEKIRNADPMIRTAELFDVFEGKNLGEGKKSMAYHLEFGADDRTLKAEDVDRVMETVRETLKRDFGAEARS
jgi:phenylalanyl-tRNA synthetase beta chain